LLARAGPEGNLEPPGSVRFALANGQTDDARRQLETLVLPPTRCCQRIRRLAPGERTFAYGGYANAHYLRSDDWALIGSNRAGNLKLYHLRRDPDEQRNVAGRRRPLASRLHRRVVEEAGGRLPYYR
jgi:arylsulfatase A-like enzyme